MLLLLPGLVADGLGGSGRRGGDLGGICTGKNDWQVKGSSFHVHPSWQVHSPTIETVSPPNHPAYVEKSI